MKDLPCEMGVGEASQKLRIAVVYSRNVFPMMRGDQLTVAHFIKYMSSRGHNISLFTTDADGKSTELQDAWLKSACDSVEIYHVGLVRRLFNAFVALVRFLPIQATIYSHPALKRSVNKAIDDAQFDVVYVYYLRSALIVSRSFSRNIPSLISGKKVSAFLAMQLSQTLNIKRIYENSKFGIKKLLYFYELKAMELFESRVWQRFTKSLFISEKDLAEVANSCSKKKVISPDNYLFSAHGTDVNKFNLANSSDVDLGRIVFSGSMLYEPNVQAVSWFYANCWEDIKIRYPGAKLYIVGRDPVKDIRAMHNGEDVIVTGSVESVAPYIAKAHVCINPMLAAGGMQNKLIEYMSSGKACVVTSIANEGIRAPRGSLVIADGSKAFSEAVLRVLNDDSERKDLEKSARLYVEKNWTWESHFQKLEENFYTSLLGEI